MDIPYSASHEGAEKSIARLSTFCKGVSAGLSTRGQRLGTTVCGTARLTTSRAGKRQGGRGLAAQTHRTELEQSAIHDDGTGSRTAQPSTVSSRQMRTKDKIRTSLSNARSNKQGGCSPTTPFVRYSPRGQPGHRGALVSSALGRKSFHPSDISPTNPHSTPPLM